MDHYITVSEILGLLAIFWLPIFGVAAVLHWRLLTGRRWRIASVAEAFVLGVALAVGVLLSPIHRFLLYLGEFGNLLAIGGIPIQSAVLSVLLVTLALLLLRRIGLPPNSSVRPRNKNYGCH